MVNTMFVKDEYSRYNAWLHVVLNPAKTVGFKRTAIMVYELHV